MSKLEGTPDLIKRIRWGLQQYVIPSVGLLKEVGHPASNEEKSQLRVVANDGRVYSIVVTELKGD